MKASSSWCGAAGNVLPLIGLVLLAAGIGNFSGSPVVQRATTLGLIAVGLTVGLHIFSGLSGILSFGHISFMALGAYSSALLTLGPERKQLTFDFPWALKFLNNVELNPFAAMAIATAVVIAFAILLAPIFARLSGVEASIATLALLIIVNVVIQNWDEVTQGQRTLVGVPAVISTADALIYAIGAILAAYVFQSSVRGRLLRACRENENAAAVLGVNVARERWIAFVFSAGVVGAGGALFAHFSYGFSANNFYLQRTFLVVAMLIIGGMGSLSGAVIGAVTVSVLTELLRQLEVGMAVGGLELDVPAGAGDVLLGIILLLVLILRPEGIVGDREIDWSFGGAAMRRLIRASTPTPVPGTGSESIDGELDRAAGRLEDGDTGDTAELS